MFGSAFLCLSPYQPNIGRYWPLFIGYPVHSTTGFWLSSVPANQPQGARGDGPPSFVFWVGGGGFGARNEAQKGRIRVAFFARAD